MYPQPKCSLNSVVAKIKMQGASPGPAVTVILSAQCVILCRMKFEDATVHGFGFSFKNLYSSGLAAHASHSTTLERPDEARAFVEQVRQLEQPPDVFAQRVGWVERSDTHHFLKRRWVSRRAQPILLASADAVALRRKRGIQDVVPAHAGTHNHLRLLEQKALATVPKSEAAVYGSPLSRGRH
jgi:hypothetical protein